VKIHHSKKELFRDNQALNDALTDAVEKNIYLRLLYEEALKEIKRVNKEVKEANDRMDKEAHNGTKSNGIEIQK